MGGNRAIIHGNKGRPTKPQWGHPMILASALVEADMSDDSGKINRRVAPPCTRLTLPLKGASPWDLNWDVGGVRNRSKRDRDRDMGLYGGQMG